MLKERLVKLRTDKGLSQYELAKILKLSRGQISNYELGSRQPDYETLKKLADFFNVTTDYLLGHDIATLLPESFPAPVEEVPIPILGSAPCGPSSTAIQEILGRIYIDKKTYEQGEHFALYAKGDSMLPTINHGDIVLVRKQSAVDNGQVAVVLIDGEESCIKRIYFNGNSCILQSDNQKYPPRSVKPEVVMILGRVMEVRKKI